jgi:hypothetical protein
MVRGALDFDASALMQRFQAIGRGSSEPFVSDRRSSDSGSAEKRKIVEMEASAAPLGAGTQQSRSIELEAREVENGTSIRPRSSSGATNTHVGG